MAITIQVDNREYEGFTRAEVFTTLDTLSGTFSFETTTLGPDKFPIKRRQACIVKVEGFTVLTGFVEIIEPSWAADKHTILIQGRDKTMDIIDSFVLKNLEISEKISLKGLIERVLEENNITGFKVINNVPDIEDFEQGEIASTGINSNIFDFLKTFARKKRVFLITDGLGNIVINRSSGIRVSQEILNISDGPRAFSSNTISGSARYDDSKRFNTYTIKSQLNTTGTSMLGGLFTNQNIVDQKNDALDSDIRLGRNLVVLAEQSTDDADLGKRAGWEANIRRIESALYTCKVQGHFRQGTKEIWRPDLLVKVQDDFASIDDILLIKSCRYSFTTDKGSTTELKLVDQDAYKEQAEKPISEKKSSNLGSLFTQ